MIKEAEKGCIVGSDKKGFYQLNLLAVPKKNADTQKMTDIRIVRHGSYKTRKKISINCIIRKDKCKIPTLPCLRKYVILLLSADYVNLFDLKDAFRQILLAESEQGCVYYTVFGLIFIDKRIAYGMASSAAICQDLSIGLLWIFKRRFAKPGTLVGSEVHIDDFLSLIHI